MPSILSVPCGQLFVYWVQEMAKRCWQLWRTVHLCFVQSVIVLSTAYFFGLCCPSREWKMNHAFLYVAAHWVYRKVATSFQWLEILHILAIPGLVRVSWLWVSCCVCALVLACLFFPKAERCASMCGYLCWLAVYVRSRSEDFVGMSVSSSLRALYHSAICLWLPYYKFDFSF